MAGNNQHLSMKKATLTTPSEDAVREILLRLDDVATLFRCAVTCKRWRRLVGKPSFLNRRNRWPPPPSLGFFSQRLGTRGTDSSSQQLMFAPLAGLSVFGTHPHALRSFLGADDVAAAAAVIDCAVPLAARGGLLLLRIYPRDEDLDSNIVRLAVCNLLAGSWDVLPELDCISNPYTCAILPSSGPERTFRVLMIGADMYEAQFNLHAFASGEPYWRAPIKCFDMLVRQIWSVEQEEAVVCQGMVHWLFVSKSSHFHILNVNAKTRHVSLTKLRSPTKEVQLRPKIVYSNRRTQQAFSANRLTTTAGGTHLSLCIYSGHHLEIWKQLEQDDGDLNRNDDDAVVWIRTTLINHKLTNLFQQLEQPSSIWSGERGSTLLITDYHRERKYVAELDKGTLKEVTGQFRDIAWSTIMPMEIDWPTFFMLRLGGPP